MKVRNLNIKNTDKPYVSISCITYNQENYIGKTIEYFLNQNVDFPVEILIHDDASTDKTPEILKKYTDEFPNIIKPILQKENQFSKGVKCIHATYNFNRSVGKYIGTCEGDDYWIDPNKLKKQINFMENNPEFSMSSHEVYFTSFQYKKTLSSILSILYKNLKLNGLSHFFYVLSFLLSGNDEFWDKRRRKGHRQSNADLNYLLKNYINNIYIPTVSIVGRGDILRKLPKELYMSPTGHKEHIFWCALFGMVKHFMDVMGQRNQQKNSLTVTEIHLNDENYKNRLKHFTYFFKKLSLYASPKQKEQIFNAIESLHIKK